MSLFNKIANSDRRTLNVIIVGCGNIGVTLAERLSNEGHYITMIDKSADAVKQVSDAYDVMGIVGNGSSYNILMEAGIENADLIIAVTDSEASPVYQMADAALLAPCEMISFVDSMVAPLSLINALVIALGSRKGMDVSRTFAELEDIWNAYGVFGKIDDE